MGVAPDPTPPASSTPPQGTYAMGALAGNPMLGAAPASSFGTPPPTNPGAPTWPAPPAPAAAGTSNHRVRNGLLAGAAALAVLGAGFGIGHATTNTGGSTQAFSPTSGSSRLPSSSGSSGGSNSFGGSGSSGSPFGNGGAFGGFGNSGSSGNTGSGSSGSSGSSGPSDVNAIASKVDPGLVDINTTLGYQQEQAAGTGIVLSSNGVILTNNHVIDGATSISVTDIGNHKTYTASVVGYDRTKDIAVLQLHNASGLQTATLGNSSNASVGEDVVGIGNAGGTGGTPSAVGGTVTALNQSITASDDGDGTSEQLSGLIETNADIQPGDSGGSLVNTSGDVLGMDTAASAGTSFQYNGQSSGTQGFAIPIDTALSIAKTIEAGSGSSTVHIGETAFLGVEINAQSSSSSGDSGGDGGGGFGGFFGGNSGSTGSTGKHRVLRIRSLGGQHGHERPRPGSRPGRGRRDHLAGRQDDQLRQRPHQRHQHLPPGRQGEHRLDRQLGADPHRHGAALLRAPAIGRGQRPVPPSRSLATDLSAAATARVRPRWRARRR